MTPLFSLVIPVFNAGRTLARCLDSILSQAYSDFEVILVDDGSTDESPSVCDSYESADSRVRVFHKPNGGVSSARNLGIDNAAGNWITFIDADDYVSPEYISAISRQVGKVKRNCLVVSDFLVLHDADGMQKTEVRFENRVSTLQNLIHTRLWQNVWNKVFSMEIIAENCIRFDESFLFFEDALFVGAYARYCSEVSVVDEICYCHFFLSDYAEKYRGSLTESGYVSYFLRMGELNPMFQQELVDDVLMRFLKMNWDVRVLKNTLGSEIIYAKGKRKFALRWLSKCDSVLVWRIVIWLFRPFYL